MHSKHTMFVYFGQKHLSIIRCNHRYLRKVDCSTHISLWNIHFNKIRVLVAGTEKGRQSWIRLGSPDCPACLVNPPALLACLLCFVPVTSTCFSGCVFVGGTNSANQTNKGGGTCHYSIYFNMISMGTANVWRGDVMIHFPEMISRHSTSLI